MCMRWVMPHGKECCKESGNFSVWRVVTLFLDTLTLFCAVLKGIRLRVLPLEPCPKPVFLLSEQDTSTFTTGVVNLYDWYMCITISAHLCLQHTCDGWVLRGSSAMAETWWNHFVVHSVCMCTWQQYKVCVCWLPTLPLASGHLSLQCSVVWCYHAR